mgnify:CR=1 FL=1
MSASENIAIVKNNIKEAAKKSGREKGQISLVAVSKTFPAEIIKTVQQSGHNLFGESYVQEFLKKQEKIPEINWNFIGQLQSNKVKYIVNKISLLHSLDRKSLADELSKRYSEQNLTIDVLVQVNIGNEIQKGGVEPEKLYEFIDYAAALSAVKIKGLMCIHPFEEPEECRKYFVRMNKLFQNAKDRGYPMEQLSMGMSADYTQAIEEGSTMVRVGSAIFGHRI